MPRQVSSSLWFALYKICLGEINSFQRLIIDGRNQDISGQTPGTGFSNSVLVGSNGTINVFTGTAGQDVGAWVRTWVSAYPDALPNQVIVGFSINPAKMAGLPRVEVIIEGLKGIEDHRTSPITTAYTRNPALILAHFIENYHQRTVDWDSVGTVADACDEAVGSGVRRQLDISLVNPTNTFETIQMLSAHAGCFVYDSGADIKLIADRPVAKVFDIGEALVMGETRLHKKGRRSQPGDVKVFWYDPINNVQKTAFAIGGGTVDNVSTLPLPGITNYEQARREAIERKNHLTLENLEIECTVRDEGLQLEIGDVVAFNDHTVGQGDKLARVMGVALDEPGRWRLSMLEYDEAAYSDSIETDPTTLDTDLPDPFTVPTITGLTATASNVTINGALVYTVDVSWTDPAWQWTQRIQIQILNTDNSPDTIEANHRLLPDSTTHKFRNLAPGTVYQVRARIVSKVAPNVVGAWATVSVTTLPSGLVGRWPFEGTVEADALAADIGNIDMQEWPGSIIFNYGVTGKVGSYAVEMDGGAGTPDWGLLVSSQEVDLPPPFTIVFWHKVVTSPAAGQYWTLFWERGIQTHLFVEYDENRDVVFLPQDATTGAQETWETGVTLADNTWQLLTVTITPSGLIFRVNKDDPLTYDTVMTPGSGGQVLRFGRNSGKVQMDQVRLFRRSLLQAEVDSIYDAEV